MGESVGTTGRRRIASLTGGFIFVESGRDEAKVQCDSCKSTIRELDGAVGGWARENYLTS
jgi:hypothetical protein